MCTLKNTKFVLNCYKVGLETWEDSEVGVFKLLGEENEFHKWKCR